jgi:5'-nucleotidase (lipoprotein e(P4) family)
MRTLRSRTICFTAIIAAALVVIIALDWLVRRFQARPDISWVENSVEYTYLCLQTYRSAHDQLRTRISGRTEPWAVIMDVDDTCLSSVGYWKAKQNRRFFLFRPTWRAWCEKGESPAVPGAAEFTRRVRELGGKIILVTARREATRSATEKNLRDEGIVYDALLMQGGGTSKEQWRQGVARGEAVAGLGPLEVVMLLGDDTGCFFPGADYREQASRFGREYFILPNPMGGATQNP